MKIENESYGLSKTTLTALLFSLLPYSQALAQNIGEEPTLRITAYQQRPVDTARVTVLP